MKKLWRKYWHRIRTEKRFSMNCLWVVLAVLTATFAISASQNVFTRNLPQTMPSPYANVINGAERYSSYTVIDRTTFESLLKNEHDVLSVTMFDHQPYLVISRDDQMHDTIVKFGDDPVETKLAERLAALKIKVNQEPAHTPDWESRQSGWFWFNACALILMLCVFAARESRRDQGGITTVLPRYPYMGYGMGAGYIGVPVPAADDDVKVEDKKTFADVAGCDEAIAKLLRVRKWLKSPRWYSLFRAKIPKGLLLVGPPGTGKTLLARALAGEADANFFSISASEFVEMYVGVGASRVRKLFDKAIAARKRTGKPSIIFIDELDAVGRKRSKGGSGGGGNDERDQTLNQLLTCMQGFKPSSGILVIAATNLAETLDPALLRPGRFDYHVSVDYPDIGGREKIFGVHTRGMQLAPEVSLRALAVRTPNMAGAHIELVCSEAGVIAAERLEHTTVGKTDEELDALDRMVTLEDFDKAVDYVQFGDEMLSRMVGQTEEDKQNTCIHEAGHAVGATASGGDPVTKLTRTIRSKSLGMMQAHSESNRYGMTEKQMRSRIITAMAGQAAQIVILGYKDTGASNDFEQASRLARYMVGAYGMSSLGMMQLKLDDQGFPVVPLSPYLASKFDKAWMGILASCEKETIELVTENRERIQRIADALMTEETILADRYKELYDGVASAEPVAGESEDKSISDAPGYSS